MKLPHYLSIVVGAIGALAAYLSQSDPARGALWSTLAGIAGSLAPVFAMATPAVGAKP